MGQVMHNNGIKKLISMLLVFTLLVASFPVMRVDAESLSATTTADVYLRSGAGTSYSAIDLLGSGTNITVTDKSNAKWYQVELSDGTEGYMCSDYISLSGSSSGGTSFTAKTTSDVNVREGAGLDYDVITVIDSDVTVTVISTSNSSWYQVKLSSGTKGYISSKYLEKTGGSTPADPDDGGDSTGYAAQTTTDVHLRKGAGTDYESLLVVDSGTKLTVINDSNDSWYRVKLSSGKTGYIYSEYIKKTSSDGSTDPGKGYDAETTADVNFRDGAGTDYDVIDVIGTGTKVTVLDDSNRSWYRVQLSNGSKGYISAQYIKKTGGGVNPPAPSDDPTDDYQAQTTECVNLRKGAGTNYESLMLVDSGTKLIVTNDSDDEWYQVKLSSGKIGYIFSEYLKKVTAPPTPDPGKEYAGETTTDVFLREGPGTNYDDIDLLATGTKLTVIDTSNSEWFKVKLSSGTTGYVSSRYLKKAGEVKPEPTTPPASVEYLKVTADSGLNLRQSASTSAEILEVLNTGAVVTNLGKSGDWYKVKTDAGVVGYVGADYVVSYQPGASSGSVSVTQVDGPICKYQTLYLKASNSNGNGVTWSSDDTGVATVANGFVYAKSEGTATITAKDKYGSSAATSRITVAGAEAVRFAYPETNTPPANEEFNMIAVTDAEKTAVRFEISDGTTATTTTYRTETESSSGLPDNTVRIWEAPVTLEKGTYSVKTYAKVGNSELSDYATNTILVGSSTSTTNATNDAHKISDAGMDIIANFEGFSSCVYPDTLAYNVPTVGYGYVVYAGDTFYNNLTRSEGRAQLVNTVNNGGFTSAMNDFAENHNIYLDQAQFDALVSFSYNVGPGWAGDSTVSDVMDTAVSFNSIRYPEPGTTIVDMGVYKDHRTSSSIVYQNLPEGSGIKATDYWVDNYSGELWYKITSSRFSGSGWVRAGYVSLDNYASGKHDQNDVDSMAFAYCLLEWHVAGGECLPGLLYRRLSEAKMFLYGNYEEAYDFFYNCIIE
ncbi:MAG: SH3 domain-containing protein, partial [Odoribacter sp.]